MLELESATSTGDIIIILHASFFSAEFESEIFLVKKERMTGDAAVNKVILLKDFQVTLPMSLPFVHSDVIDVSVIVILRDESDLVDITFSQSGEMSNGILTLEPEVVFDAVSYTHLTLPTNREV